MSFDVRLSITGIQEAQQRNLRAIAALSPVGALGRAVKYGTIEAHRYAVAITDVDTGSLKSSHRMDVNGTRGVIYVDPGATNPRSLQGVADYAKWEHRRGGSHAFYARVESERGAQIARSMGHIVKVGVSGS